MTTTNKPPSRKGGAPLGNKNSSKPEGSHMKVVRATVRPDQVALFKLLGGSEWLRGVIDRARC
jgi:hypothetical protein